MSEQRTRSRVVVEDDHDFISQTDSNGGSLNTGSYLVGYEKERMEDYVTKGFEQKIARGSIINNPCMYTHDRLQSSEGSVTVLHNTGYWYKQLGPHREQT